MQKMDFVIAYVADALKSEPLYTRLFGQKSADSRPGFVMFILPGGLRFGLWTRSDVAPKPDATGGGVEVGFPLADEATLRQTFEDWKGLGLKVLQPPTPASFGLTFTLADGDGHRLRGYVPALRG
jgi:catechol 2,3-dioxygenase-like lactoylglutathione lyase family enzyme